MSSRLICGVTGGLDLGLLGLLSECDCTSCAPERSRNCSGLVTRMDASELLRQLDSNVLQLGVMSLENVLDHASQHPQTSVRILGSLLGGDCRALVSLRNDCEGLDRRMIGAAHAEAAFARWQDISCAYDVECREDRTEHIESHKLLDALMRGQHSLLEVNLFWEGLMGFRRGLIHKTARAGEYGIPVGASHLIVTNEETLCQHSMQLKDLRQTLLQLYQSLLQDTERFVAHLNLANVFHRRPDQGFLLASARILAPHCEEFLRTEGRPDRQAVQSFVRWYDTRVRPLSPVGAGSYLGVSLDELFCDPWA